jgi:protein-tyrosine phosphatase
MREFQLAPENIDVPDPYYGDEDGFDSVYNILDDSIGSFLEHLKSEHKIFV